MVPGRRELERRTEVREKGCCRTVGSAVLPAHGDEASEPGRCGRVRGGVAWGLGPGYVGGNGVEPSRISSSSL